MKFFLGSVFFFFLIRGLLFHYLFLLIGTFTHIQFLWNWRNKKKNCQLHTISSGLLNMVYFFRFCLFFLSISGTLWVLCFELLIIFFFIFSILIRSTAFEYFDRWWHDSTDHYNFNVLRFAFVDIHFIHLWPFDCRSVSILFFHLYLYFCYCFGSMLQ